MLVELVDELERGAGQDAAGEEGPERCTAEAAARGTPLGRGPSGPSSLVA